MRRFATIFLQSYTLDGNCFCNSNFKGSGFISLRIILSIQCWKNYGFIDQCITYKLMFHYVKTKLVYHDHVSMSALLNTLNSYWWFMINALSCGRIFIWHKSVLKLLSICLRMLKYPLKSIILKLRHSTYCSNSILVSIF